MIPAIFYSLMIISHIGVFIFNDNNFMVIGIPVIPFFAFMIVQGSRATHDTCMYLLRLIVVAVASEYLYFLMTGHAFNDIIGLFIGLLIISHLSEKMESKYKILIYVLTLYIIHSISFKLAYIVFWVFMFDVIADFKTLRIKRLFRKSYLNYLIYPVHIIAILIIRELM